MSFYDVIHVVQILSVFFWIFAIYSLRRIIKSNKISDSALHEFFKSTFESILQLELRIIELEKDIQILKSK